MREPVRCYNPVQGELKAQDLESFPFSIKLQQCHCHQEAPKDSGEELVGTHIANPRKSQ